MYVDGTDVNRDAEMQLIRNVSRICNCTTSNRLSIEEIAILKSRQENPEHWKKVDELVAKKEKEIFG
jgi:hypothetical protein